MTPEQIAALKEIASKAAEHIPHVHGCQCMKVFERTLRPTTCKELLEEVERLRDENISLKELRNDLLERVEVLKAR
jgi:hypothetical protein